MNLADFLSRIDGVPYSIAASELKRKSKDFFWFSPILSEQLKNCEADVVVCPRTVDEVIRIAAASAATGVPLTPRGGGTGNYGQAVPLQRGAVIDMTALDRLVSLENGIATVDAGKTLFSLEEELRAHGHELRMFPSTWRQATIGGFVSGGTGGVGSVTWGGLREPGNLIEATIVTVEAEPRIVTLTGTDCNVVNRTFGTTGLLVQLKIPAQPAVAWQDLLVAFDRFEDAVAFGAALCRAQGIQKRLCSISDERIAAFYKPFAEWIPNGCSVAGLIVAPAGVLAAGEMAAAHGGRVMLHRATEAAEKDATPIYEIAFNHATQHVLRRERGHTYLQSLYPSPDVLHALRAELGEEVMWHHEMIGLDGGHSMNGLPVLKFTHAARLEEVIAIHERAGAPVANPHVFTVEDGSRYKRLSGDQLGFKREVDPKGLLNPGKMRTFTVAASA